VPFFILRPFSTKNAELFLAVFCPVAKTILGVDMDLEKLDPEISGKIIVCNHQDSLDLVIFGLVMRKKVTVIGKKQIFWLPFFGLSYWLSGQLFIDRSNLNKAKQTLENAKKRLFKDGHSIIIMPEGTRSRGKGLGPFKKGAFHLALETGAPILPMVVSSYHKFVQFNRLHSGKVKSRFLNEVDTSKFNIDSINEFKDHVRELMLEGINELDSQLA
jgi:1-acyl-sn-glycerol-3-phosphate acyltransferase